MDAASMPFPAHSRMTFANRFDHWTARFAVNRGGHRVEPGLYALGEPTPDSPVFVGANYTLSFDALRTALAGRDAFLLVLDTQGVNVWCAAGKGTFGTEEIVKRAQSARLGEIVRHRTLILPQLGASGVAAHEVKRRTGFKVEYGPVRARDLPAFLETRKATPEMRRVRFGLGDRLVLVPVELVAGLVPLLITAILLRSIGLSAAILAGAVLFPVLLPFLPTKDFSTKGLLLGLFVALALAGVHALITPAGAPLFLGWKILSDLLLIPPVTAFLALNFTGSSTFTSRTGVRKEISNYIPVMAWMFGLGVALTLGGWILQWTGVWHV